MPNAERQRAYRQRLKDEGKQVVHLALLPDIVQQLDSLRDDGSSREEVVERLVKAAVRRRKR